jgi:hypothetical protein
MPPAATESHQRTTVIWPSWVGLEPMVFEGRTGGNVSITAEKKGRGGAFKVASLPGPGEIGDITVRRSFETLRDGKAAGRLEPLQGTVEGVQVISEFLDASRNPHPQLRPRRWADCTFMSMSVPDHNADSGTTGMLELTLAPATPAKS